MGTGSAPRARTIRSTSAVADGEASLVGVRTQGRPRNNSGSDAPNPRPSFPAIGWPPTKRDRSCSGTASTTATLTPAQSVTMLPPGHGYESKSSVTPGGVAKTTKLGIAMASARLACACRTARAASAAARVAASGSTPCTDHPAAVRARAIDPPIRPSPTTSVRPSCVSTVPA